MEFDHFMFDEAFNFHDRNQEGGNKTKTNQNQFPEHGDEVVLIDDTCRLPPLGACSSELESQPHDSTGTENDPISHKLKEEHIQLNNSLLALTSHFAQVQFRLKQIIQGPKESHESLLAELEEFAFAGCPDVAGPSDHKIGCPSCSSKTYVQQYERRISEERECEKRLDSHLKKMLHELEIEQKELLNKKKSSLHQQHKKPLSRHEGKKILNEKDSLCKFDPTEQPNNGNDDENGNFEEGGITKYVDQTMAKLINPKKAKEDVISQVSKQIRSMEKFVSYLQSYESSPETDYENVKSLDSAMNSKNTASKNGAKNDAGNGEVAGLPAPHTKILKLTEEKRKKMQEASIAVMKKGMTVLQIFAISQFGCSARHFREYMVRKTEQATKSNAGFNKPFETFRSAVDKLIMLHTKLVDVGGLTPDSEDELNLPISSMDKRASWSKKRSESVSSDTWSNAANSPTRPIVVQIQEDVIRLVRGEFASSLKELIQHGLCQSFQASNLSTKALVGCMSSHSTQAYGMHIWELFDKFYHLKRGHDFNHQPTNTLAEAFAMDIGCMQQNAKQALLTVLHRIKTTHEPRKRSYDAMYKALISASLNRGRLAQWVRLVIRCPEFVDKHFERWSYVIRTGFDDVLTTLEKLSALTFFLPEDLAIRHLLKNTNEFGDA